MDENRTGYHPKRQTVDQSSESQSSKQQESQESIQNMANKKNTSRKRGNEITGQEAKLRSW